MKVAIDTSPTLSGHSLRGIGSYTRNLISNLKSAKSDLEFEFFSNPKKAPKADLVHYTYFDLFFHTLPIIKSAKRVVTIHDVIPLVYPEHFPVGIRGDLNLFLQKFSLKNVDFVITDSKTSKDDISKNLSYPKEKIEVIYLAASVEFKKITDLKKLDNSLKKFSLPRDFILYVGDVNWNKNIDNLLEAVKISNVALVMVGNAVVDEALPQTKAINKKIRELRIEKRVIKTGFVEDEDLINLYNLAKLTILPSFYEGFGLPVLESMSCGTPVVCSKTSSLIEIGDEIVNYCDPHDPKDIAKKIRSVLDLSVEEKEEMAKKLISHSAKFTWTKVVKETVKVYEKFFHD